MKLDFSGQIFEKTSNIKLHENQSNGSRVIPWGRTFLYIFLVGLKAQKDKGGKRRLLGDSSGCWKGGGRVHAAADRVPVPWIWIPTGLPLMHVYI